MKYTLTILEEHLDKLKGHISSLLGKEGAAYLLCGQSATLDERRLLVRDVIPVDEAHFLRREAFGLSIDSASYAFASKIAIAKKASLLFVHSHPQGPRNHSLQDDGEEPKLMEFFGTRMPAGLCGSMVLSNSENLVGRLWVDRTWKPLERIRIIGTGWKFIDLAPDGSSKQEVFERQVLAFGRPIQNLLHRLRVGIVGVGGTGSCIAEILTRLGVGNITVFDGDSLDASNVSRVYGSTLKDVGRPKVEISADHLRAIGLTTEVSAFGEYITDEESAKKLRGCDIVFCCTDNRHAPRGILVQLALRYLIPVIDVGASIDSKDLELRGVYARTTVLQPGEACLFCRRRIDSEHIAAEGMSPQRRKALAEEGYAPELAAPDPSVIALTTLAAAEGALEFMSRLTGFRGEFGTLSERITFAHVGEVRANRTESDPNCVCAQKEHWGAGDSARFLGLSWS